MKIKLLYSSAILGFGLMALASFSSGATSGVGDKTGSPLSTGTCEGCHSTGTAGSFVPTVSVSLTDAGGTAVTNGMYTPGATYTVEITIGNTGGGTPQYGMQMTSLNGSNAMAGALTNPSAGAKITASSGVDYLEHAQRSTTGIFSAEWTAPASGTGDVTVYAAGLAINNNFGTSGDNYVNTSVTLSEATGTSIATVNNQTLDYNIYPNPITNSRFFIDGVNGDANIAVRDIAGRVVYQVNATIQNGYTVNLPQLPQGVYAVTVSQDDKVGTQKVIL